MTCQRDHDANRLALMGLVALLLLPSAGCDSVEQPIHIVAQDFRFAPAEVRVSAERPIRLTVVNEGRERHEFKSPLLAHQPGATSAPPSSLPLLPNRQTQTGIRTVSGVYHFYCAIRGHAGMSGTIIVE